jgi:hypothetical protein
LASVEKPAYGFNANCVQNGARQTHTAGFMYEIWWGECPREPVLENFQTGQFPLPGVSWQLNQPLAVLPKSYDNHRREKQRFLAKIMEGLAGLLLLDFVCGCRRVSHCTGCGVQNLG